MEIAPWSHSPREAAAERVGHRRTWSPGVLGLMGTLLLHAIVLQSVVLGTRAHKVRPPDAQGPGATLIQSATGPAEALILVELPSVDMKAQALSEDLASAGSAPTNPLVTMISPDPLPHIDIPADKLDDNANAPAALDSGDPAGRALLFGRYSGQIQAHIERAWRRPRSPVSEGSDSFHQTATQSSVGISLADDSFRCQVRILQDRHGAVQEVQILSCNGTVTWRQSLVAAILAASPLPSPPDPAVFTGSLTLTFEGQTYVAGNSSDGYDIARASTAPIAGTLGR